MKRLSTISNHLRPLVPQIRINPDLVSELHIAQSGYVSFVIERPTIIEKIVNNVMVKRALVMPGIYNTNVIPGEGYIFKPRARI